MRSNRFVSLNRPMLSLEAHLGVTASPQAPFPTDFVTLPVSASHRRFGSLPLAAEKGHAPVPQHQLHRVLHSKHAQATSPPCWRATLAGRTVGLIHSPTSIHWPFPRANPIANQTCKASYPSLAMLNDQSLHHVCASFLLNHGSSRKTDTSYRRTS